MRTLAMEPQPGARGQRLRPTSPSWFSDVRFTPGTGRVPLDLLRSCWMTHSPLAWPEGRTHQHLWRGACLPGSHVAGYVDSSPSRPPNSSHNPRAPEARERSGATPDRPRVRIPSRPPLFLDFRRLL